MVNDKRNKAKKYKALSFLPSIFACLFLPSCAKLEPDPYEYGAFYTIENLYNCGALNKDDVLNICYWSNNRAVYKKIGNEGDYKKIARDEYTIRDKGELSSEMEGWIIHDWYLKKARDGSWDAESHKLEESDVAISMHCGNYDGYIAILFSCPWYLNYTQSTYLKEIAGYSFLYNDDGIETVLWKAF